MSPVLKPAAHRLEPYRRRRASNRHEQLARDVPEDALSLPSPYPPVWRRSPALPNAIKYGAAAAWSTGLAKVGNSTQGRLPPRHILQIISLGVIRFTLTGRVQRYLSARSPTIWGLSGKLANGGHHDRVR